MLYRRLLRPLLFGLPAETAHHLAMGGLRVAEALPPVRHILRQRLAPRDPALETRALGYTFPSPVGLAAGFDKDALAPRALYALGFGFVEVGTVTAEGQPGNPRPRLFRLEKDRALINRMGFNNRGAEVARRRLRHRDRSRAGAERQYLLGINVGKSKVTPEAHAAEDYARSVRALGEHADYLVINVSSPNTPGLRDLQATEKLAPLIEATQRSLEDLALTAPPPVLIKVAPDLDEEALKAIASLCAERGVAGLIATNTTISRAGLRTPEEKVAEIGAGGLSGAPLKDRALEVLRLLHREVGGSLCLIASGGIEDADDAWARVRAGATLVQLYTGFIYGGPSSARTVALGLANRARALGYPRVQDAVGADA